MTPLEGHLDQLKEKFKDASKTPLPSGAHLITIPDVLLPAGWNRATETIYFLAPPGYPGGQPDCFWVGQVNFRLANGATPQASNDANPIPEVGQRGTWFSWHLQTWNPNTDSLLTYFNVIMQRLNPPR